jgi:hypothetical protein
MAWPRRAGLSYRLWDHETGVSIRRCVLRTVLLLVLLGAAMAAEEPRPASAGDQDSTWRYVSPSGSALSLPIRIVGEDEPWEQVVQDVQAHLAAAIARRPVRVGFYGHGAFVKRTEVQHDLPFVAALGMAAEMDVMVFPHWRFPDKVPFIDIPQQVLQDQLNNQRGETVLETVKRKTREHALDHRYATAHAAVRLAEGISTFHTRRMTPFVAAFSNSALVLVRLGQLLEQEGISDGYKPVTVNESVRQGIYLNNVVTFGYPLPNGQVSAGLQQRIRGTWVNVVPAECWKQLAGNFLLRGGKNLAVSWAPAHANWPRLSPQGPEVTALGTLLGDHDAVRSVHLPTWPGPRASANFPVLQWMWDTICEQVQLRVFDRS